MVPVEQLEPESLAGAQQGRTTSQQQQQRREQEKRVVEGWGNGLSEKFPAGHYCRHWRSKEGREGWEELKEPIYDVCGSWR